jgi:peroxiredoxin
MMRTCRTLATAVLAALTLGWLVPGTAVHPVRADPPTRPLRVTRAPEFARVTEWVNSKPLTMAALRGKVVVVHFWTNGCSNCINNYPHYRAWQHRYAGKDVVIVGIHTPETPSEHNVERIRAQASKNGLKFPIAVDNDLANWKAWDNHIWPTVYVVDQRGAVRYGWEGELNYAGQKGEETVRRVIDTLLAAGPGSRATAARRGPGRGSRP